MNADGSIADCPQIMRIDTDGIKSPMTRCDIGMVSFSDDHCDGPWVHGSLCGETAMSLPEEVPLTLD